MVKELDSLSWNSYEEIENSTNQLERSNKTQIDGALVLQQSEQNELSPTFGNISISNGSDIHFGNKTFYQGPVTIKQFVVADGEKLKKIGESEVSQSLVEKLNLRNVDGGLENPSFQDDSGNNKGNDNRGGKVSQPSNEEISSYLTDLKKLVILYRTPSILICLCLIIISLTAVTLTHLWRNVESPIINHDDDNIHPVDVDDEHSHNTPIEGPIDPTKIKPLVLKMVSRLEWLAQPPTQPADPLKTPVPYVIISHTATETCKSQAQCVFQVRYIQTYHMESRGWWDIGYNFLVGGDGEVYVGRGWDKEGAHTLGYNKYSIGISFVGTFINILPTKNQLLACRRLIERGVELGYIKKDYKLLGARQLQTTQSPGTKLFEEIKSWPHWSENP